MTKPMRVYYDSEFLEESGHVDVISMGFVREDGRELYFVLNSFDTLKVARHRWLMENVMPSIKHEEVTSHVTGLGTPMKDLVLMDENVLSQAQARARILGFVSDIWPEFWAWYGAYDHVALCSLFGRMVDLPSRFPMFTHDLKQWHKEAGSPDMPKQEAGHHNALDDARHNKVRWWFLAEKLGKIGRDPITWVLADNPLQVEWWLQLNRRDWDNVRALYKPDQLRGMQIFEGDVVIPLASYNDEWSKNLRISQR